MTYAQFATLIRFHTRTDSTTFTDAEIKVLANTYKDQMAVRILGANENYFGAPMLDDLVLNQREYPLDATVAGAIKFVEIKIDGTNWRRIYETDFNLETLTTDETGIVSAFTGRNPEFAIFRNSLWILSSDPIIAVTDGLKVWAYIWPADFTDLTLATEMAAPPAANAHGWPRQFQELLARKIVVAYKESRDKPMVLNQTEQSFEKDFTLMLDGIMHPNQDRTFLAQTPRDDGSNY